MRFDSRAVIFAPSLFGLLSACVEMGKTVTTGYPPSPSALQEVGAAAASLQCKTEEKTLGSGEKAISAACFDGSITFYEQVIGESHYVNVNCGDTPRTTCEGIAHRVTEKAKNPNAASTGATTEGALANRFCAQAAKEAPGRVSKCEDFNGVAEGTLPKGWLGGGGLIVKRSDALAGLNILTTFERRGKYTITMPLKFGGDWRLDWMEKFPQVAESQLLVGNVSVTKFTYDNGLELNSVGADGANGAGTKVKREISADYHQLALVKNGDVYKLMYDGQQVALARYENLPAPESITIKANGEFSVAGIRVEGAAP